MDDLTKQSTQRTIYYFHMTHTNLEIGIEPASKGWLERNDVQIYREWGDIENKLNSLPAAPNKMYNDSFKKVYNDGSIETVPPEMVPFIICDLVTNRGLSPNDVGLINLSKKGCTLVLCESRELHNLQHEVKTKIHGSVQISVSKFIAFRFAPT